MRIVLISEYHSLVSVGGTEYYLDTLVQQLCVAGHEILVIAQGKQKNIVITEQGNGLQNTYSIVLLPAKDFSDSEIRLSVVSSSWQLILKELTVFLPEVIHVHTYTTFFNIRHLELCFANGFKNIIFTSHIAGHFCPKGDLIRNNRVCCDGVLSNQCYTCMFTKNFKSGLSNLLHRYHKKLLHDLQAMSNLGIKMIVTAQWQKEQLIRNGFHPDKIKVIRQVIETKNYQKGSVETSKKFSVGFLGRLTEEKGATLLLKLIKSFQGNHSLQFILGIPPGNSQESAMAELQNYIASDNSNVVLNCNVNSQNKHEFFTSIDCLFIPSFCIETGPIVLLEALLYNRIVIAPDVGGPLEFAQRFGDVIQLYKWNHIHSVKQIIERLIQNLSIKEQIDYRTVFNEDRQKFIEAHLAVYNESYVSQK